MARARLSRLGADAEEGAADFTLRILPQSREGDRVRATVNQRLHIALVAERLQQEAQLQSPVSRIKGAVLLQNKLDNFRAVLRFATFSSLRVDCTSDSRKFLWRHLVREQAHLFGGHREHLKKAPQSFERKTIRVDDHQCLNRRIQG